MEQQSKIAPVYGKTAKSSGAPFQTLNRQSQTLIINAIKEQNASKNKGNFKVRDKLTNSRFQVTTKEELHITHDWSEEKPILCKEGFVKRDSAEFFNYASAIGQLKSHTDGKSNIELKIEKEEYLQITDCWSESGYALAAELSPSVRDEMTTTTTRLMRTEREANDYHCIDEKPAYHRDFLERNPDKFWDCAPVAGQTQSQSVGDQMTTTTLMKTEQDTTDYWNEEKPLCHLPIDSLEMNSEKSWDYAPAQGQSKSVKDEMSTAVLKTEERTGLQITDYWNEEKPLYHGGEFLEGDSDNYFGYALGQSHDTPDEMTMSLSVKVKDEKNLHTTDDRSESFSYMAATGYSNIDMAIVRGNAYSKCQRGNSMENHVTLVQPADMIKVETIEYDSGQNGDRDLNEHENRRHNVPSEVHSPDSKENTVAIAQPNDYDQSCIKLEVISNHSTYDENLDSKNHMETHSPHKWQCSICPKQFAMENSLIQHLEYHNGDVYNCSECSKSFSKKRNLKQHVARNHSGKKHQCNICDKQFTFKSKLSQHMESHSGVIQNCFKCSKSFSTKKYLKQHEEIHAEKKYQCDICTKKLSRKYYLKLHMETHSSEKYQCSICAKRYFKTYLRQHMKTHSGIKFQCNICAKQTTSEKGLRQHIESHSGVIHYCSECYKPFSTIKCLKKHERIHAEKKYQCDICAKQYSFKSELNLHLETHGGVQCSICAKKLCTRYYLKEHMKRHSGAMSTCAKNS